MTATNFLRAGVRIPLELPIEVRWKGRGGKRQHAQGKTVTISGNGIYVVLPARLAQQTPIRFRVDLPVEFTHVPTQLLGEARVVRQIPENAVAGIAAIIDDYQFLPKPPMV